MFFVIPEMPSKTFVMFYKKLPDHFKLLPVRNPGGVPAGLGVRGSGVLGAQRSIHHLPDVLIRLSLQLLQESPDAPCCTLSRDGMNFADFRLKNFDFFI